MAFAQASQTARTASAATPSSTFPRCEPRPENLPHLDEAVLGRRQHQPEVVDHGRRKPDREDGDVVGALVVADQRSEHGLDELLGVVLAGRRPPRRAGAAPRRAASHDARRGRRCRAGSSSPARAAPRPPRTRAKRRRRSEASAPARGTTWCRRASGSGAADVPQRRTAPAAAVGRRRGTRASRMPSPSSPRRACRAARRRCADRRTRRRRRGGRCEAGPSSRRPARPCRRRRRRRGRSSRPRAG